MAYSGLFVALISNDYKILDKKLATNTLKELLDQAGLSQEDLAQESGVSVSTVNKVYNRKRSVAPKTMGRITNAINALSNQSYSIADVFPKYKP